MSRGIVREAVLLVFRLRAQAVVHWVLRRPARLDGLGWPSAERPGP